jgi:hypothetical protein
LNCAAVCPAGISPDPAPNWLVVSMTTFPASAPAAASASPITGHGTETTTASLSATASDTFSAAETREPICAASRSSAPGSRENVTITSCPAPARNCASPPPMCPAPMMPTRTITLLQSDTSTT